MISTEVAVDDGSAPGTDAPASGRRLHTAGAIGALLAGAVFLLVLLNGSPTLLRSEHDPAGRDRKAHARPREEPGAKGPGGRDGDGEAGQRGAHADGRPGPPEHGRTDHGAGGVQAHQVPVGEPVPARESEVHRLLHEDVAGPAGGAEEDAVAEGELRQPLGGRGEQRAESAGGRAPEDQTRRRRETDAQKLPSRRRTRLPFMSTT